MYGGVKSRDLQGPIAAKILLRTSSPGFGCMAVRLSRDGLLLMSERAKDLPLWFLVALAPSFEPTPCAVVWQNGDVIRVAVFDGAELLRAECA